MNSKWFLVTVMMTFLLAFASGNAQNSVIPYAINEVINEHYAKLSSKLPGIVNLVVFVDKTSRFSRLVVKLLKIKSVDVKFKIKKVNLSKFKKKKKFDLGESSIVFFESVKTFQADAPKIKWAYNKQQRSQHLIHVPELESSDNVEVLPDGFEIDEVNFLIRDNESSIEIVTSFMFTNDACRELQIKTINRYNADERKWENSNFYPKKYRNFHGCELKIAITEDFNSANGRLMDMIFTKGLNANLNVVNTTIQDCDECDLTR